MAQRTRFALVSGSRGGLHTATSLQAPRREDPPDSAGGAVEMLAHLSQRHAAPLRVGGYEFYPPVNFLLGKEAGPAGPKSRFRLHAFFKTLERSAIEAQEFCQLNYQLSY